MLDISRLLKSAIIGGPDYMKRWFIIVLAPLIEIYVHRFNGPDAGRDTHDHPWLMNVTIVLRGEYEEYEVRTMPGMVRVFRKKTRRAGRVYVRFGRAEHRIESVAPGTYTLFIGLGRWREWGFYSREGRFTPSERA